MMIEPITTPRTQFLTTHMRTIPRLFIDHNGNRIEVAILEKHEGHAAVLVQAVEGYPFDMALGEGLSFKKPGDVETTWYDRKWVNASEIEEIR